jgi:tetratricopeptide (TPR) repeat protein
MMSYAHNLYFLWSTLCMEGWSAESLGVARELGGMVPVEIARQGLQMELFTLTPLFTLARFGKWGEILKEPRPPADLQVSTGIWRYARGLALAATGRLEEAGKEAGGVAAVAARTSIPLLHIASNALAGELAARRGQTDEAVRRLREAVRIQDAIGYRDPPAWYYPVRQSLGAVLLASGRASDAEAVYREDLKQNPENGWSLYGLAQCLRARKAEAAAVDQRFRKAWARADVTVSASRF